jgi:subtilisin-like proprotein convertase family protein
MIKLRLETLLLGVMLAPVAQLGRADELPAWLTERRIIGHNDLEPIEAAANTVAYEDARIVARLETLDGEGFCTASRIAKNLFLSNFHCYDYKPCNEIQFHLGYEKAMVEGDRKLFTCAEVLAKNLTLDYAIFRVEEQVPLPAGNGQTFAFDDLALSIPDNDVTGVSKDFAITLAGTIANIEVHVKATHTYVGDLHLELTSPAGTKVVLQDRSSSSTSGLDKTYTVAGGLRPFVGQAATGTWKLIVQDLAANDVGTLDAVDFMIQAKPERMTEAKQKALAAAEALEYPTAVLWAGPIHVDQLLYVAGHPSARLKEIDRGPDCKIRTIETETMDERTTITHTCDTEGGSSGSPVLDRETGRVVALHWGGTDAFNMAIPMSLIAKDLETSLTPEAFSELKIER